MPLPIINLLSPYLYLPATPGPLRKDASMKFLRAMAGALLLGSLSSTILAQTQPTLSTIIQSDGTVKALYESQAVVTAQFWDFAENWNRITSWQTTGNGST